MEITVVPVVIKIGLIRIAPASTSALSRGISARNWFTVSTYKIPLFTTVPTNIRKPNIDTILIGLSARNSIPKDPISENGMVVIIISENLGDSNWIAITTNTRKTPVIRAPPKAPISLPMLSSMAFGAISTSFGIFQLRTNSLTSFSAVFLYSDCGSIVIDTWYCLFLRWICCGLSS